jgi:putative hydrolase of the HAD superfamily
MIRAVVFDCFGVILTDVLSEIRAELAQRDPGAAEEIRGIIAANNRGLIEPRESNEQIASLLGMDPHVFRQQVREGETKNEPLLSYILDLRKSYKTAMLSNIAGSSLDRRFPNNELAQYFDVVAASADIGYAKPDREAYLHVADALGVRPEECLFTDDKEGFCTAATSVGMHSIVYTDFIQFKTALGKILAT